jgi:hypothetical protein
MIWANKWLTGKSANVLLVLAGIGLAAIPVSVGLLVENHVLALSSEPTGFDAFLFDLNHVRYVEKIAGGMILLGFAISLTGMFRMLRYDS